LGRTFMAARHFPSAGGLLALRYCSNEAVK